MFGQRGCNEVRRYETISQRALDYMSGSGRWLIRRTSMEASPQLQALRTPFECLRCFFLGATTTSRHTQIGVHRSRAWPRIFPPPAMETLFQKIPSRRRPCRRCEDWVSPNLSGSPSEAAPRSTAVQYHATSAQRGPRKRSIRTLLHSWCGARQISPVLRSTMGRCRRRGGKGVRDRVALGRILPISVTSQ